MVQKSEKNDLELNKIKERKNDHLKICIKKNVKSKNTRSGFKDLHLIHRALPEINKKDIDLSTKFFGHHLSAPIVIEGMTGGTKIALKINSSLALAAEELGIGMGVGSQRAALENPKLQKTFSIVRKKAPNIFLIANIGASQIAYNDCIDLSRKAIEMIQADALAIHLNPIQESIQPEGQTNYRNILNNIGKICREIKTPIIVKETGSGIAFEEAKKLHNIGVSCIDIAGAGGTSWVGVEFYRALEKNDRLRQELGKIFWDWGIPTVISLIEVLEAATDLKVIASGGIRSGLHIAKSIALGADLAGFAHPMLRPALKNSTKVIEKIEIFLEELRAIMFVTGAQAIENLKEIPIIITGNTADWLKLRGIKLEKYSIKRWKK